MACMGSEGEVAGVGTEEDAHFYYKYRYAISLSTAYDEAYYMNSWFTFLSSS